MGDILYDFLGGMPHHHLATHVHRLFVGICLAKRDKWPEFLSALKVYSDMKHSKLVPVEDLSKPDSETYYLPMHGVVKESSTTTKLRVVFDATAKSTSGHSLNEVLLSGPVLYPLLVNILVKFRQHSFGMSVDFSRMFREVSLHLEDRDFHHYVMKNEEGLVQDLGMAWVTFGVTSSPFLATQALRQASTRVS